MCRNFRELLEARGCKEIKLEQARDWNFVLGDKKGREIDVHVIVLDRQGDGIYGPPERGEKYPAASLTGSGMIEGQRVGYISPEWTVKFHFWVRTSGKGFSRRVRFVQEVRH